ncbi:MAG TPA: DUF2147 domain-containing protein [Burkholderiales bacterium]|nr:DUF2147 domain-containing protein [Burkholderiales bacterium]
MDAMKILIVAAGLMVVSGLAAAAGSPVGTWRSIDDKTKQERSIIRITEDNDELKGVVEKVFDQPGDDPDHLCKECKGERKDKPVIGMTILWGLKKDGDVWAGGEILDPKNGKTYRCKMTLSEDGQSLNVRGFIGISLIGRTQIWYRE